MFRIAGHKLTLCPSFSISAMDKGERERSKKEGKECTGKFNLGLGWRVNSGDGAPLGIVASFAPAAFARIQADQIRFEGQHMVVRDNDGHSLTVEVATGRLVEANPEGTHIRFERGALDRLLREIDDHTRDFANLYDARHPWASWGI